MLWLHSLLVVSQVKSKWLVSAEESAAPWWFNRPGQPNSSAVVALERKKNLWSLLYNPFFPLTSLFLLQCPQISVETYCCLVQQLCSHILHITGGFNNEPAWQIKQCMHRQIGVFIIRADPHPAKQIWRQTCSPPKPAEDFTANWCGAFYNVPAWVLIEP